MRSNLGWCFLGCVVVQCGLAVGVDQFWPAVRDPENAGVVKSVRAQSAEVLGRPVVLVFGSSRMKMALRAERLNHPEDEDAPLVMNCAMPQSGPMMQEILLRQVLAAGVRPRLVYLEIIPFFIGQTNGSSVEQRRHDVGARLTAAEIASVCRYHVSNSHRVWYSWAMGRLVPVYRHQLGAHAALGIDQAAVAPTGGVLSVDQYGWLRPPESLPAETVQQRSRDALLEWEFSMKQSAAALGSLRALTDAVSLCRARDIAVLFIVAPESSTMRSFCPAATEAQLNAVRGLAHELGVPLIDARTWVDDDKFYDGHHVFVKGAEQYTERFAREALAPHWAGMRRDLHAHACAPKTDAE